LVFAGIALGVSEGQFGTFDRAVILGLHNVVERWGLLGLMKRRVT
jgi:hypothetical protein